MSDERKLVMRDKYIVAYCVDMNGRGRISSAFRTFVTLDEAEAHKSEVLEEHQEYVVSLYTAEIIEKSWVATVEPEDE